MAKRSVYYYYRIYDDKEQFNYIRSTFQEKKIRAMLRKYEKAHEEYYNSDFIEFLRKYDPKADFVDVTSISY
jgi:hypothetical protein